MGFEAWNLDLSCFFCKQANEVVKANNLSDTIIVLHGRVEVGLYDQANSLICFLKSFIRIMLMNRAGLISI